MCNRIRFQKGESSLFEQILAALGTEGGKHGLCGGRGACGRCRVRFPAQAPIPSTADRRFLTPAQLREGYRLACTARPDADCEVELYFEKGPEAEIVTVCGIGGESGAPFVRGAADSGTRRGQSLAPGVMSYLFCAVDLGTTTVVMQLTDSITGDSLYTYAFRNPQRAYGVDVLSRILAAESGKAGVMREMLTAELEKGLRLMEETGKPERVIVSGNMAMGHILLGYPAGSLGKAPFTPYHRGSSRFFLGGYPAVFMPGISAFVGADIVSGMYACGMADKKEQVLFIDLGTNGEMAAGNREGILCTAAAAGSAFEGSVSPEVMGTDLTAIAYDMLTEGIMDETGLMAEPWFTEGYPAGKAVVRQSDIRNLQMAKAAICAGAEILLERMDLWERTAHVYLAGGFGYYLDVGKAVEIGLIPEILQEKCTAVGNASLAGAVRYGRQIRKAAAEDGSPEKDSVDVGCLEQGGRDGSAEEEKLRRLIQVSQCLNLAEQPEFQTRYIEAMAFRRIRRRK